MFAFKKPKIKKNCKRLSVLEQQFGDLYLKLQNNPSDEDVASACAARCHSILETKQINDTNSSFCKRKYRKKCFWQNFATTISFFMR